MSAPTQAQPQTKRQTIRLDATGNTPTLEEPTP